MPLYFALQLANELVRIFSKTNPSFLMNPLLLFKLFNIKGATFSFCRLHCSSVMLELMLLMCCIIWISQMPIARTISQYCLLCNYIEIVVISKGT